jgi:hypothetical protein
MAGSIKSRSLVAIVLFAEAFTLAVLFGLPALQGRVYSYPHFPRVIVFHDRPPGCIVDFQGNFFAAAAESTLFWICMVLVSAGMRRLIRNNDRRVDQEISRLRSQGL